MSSHVQISLVLVSIIMCVGCAPSRADYGSDFERDYKYLSQVDQHLAEGDRLSQQGRHDQALDQYASAAELNPADKRVLWRIVCAATFARDPTPGVRALKLLVELDPTLETDPDLQRAAQLLVDLSATDSHEEQAQG